MPRKYKPNALSVDHLDTFILVRVERFEYQTNQVIFDFIESNNFTAFSNYINQGYSLGGPSMVLLKNYHGRKVREGVIYSVNRETLTNVKDRIILYKDSLIILLEIDLSVTSEEFFGQSISEAQLESPSYWGLWPQNYSMHLRGTLNTPDDISFDTNGNTSVIVKNVGQGSWNEICLDGTPKVIFDFGTSHHTKASTLPTYIGNKETEYQLHKPGLVISHWDVDHYHFLKALADETIKSFAFIICRDYVPSLTSRVIFSKLKNVATKLIAIQCDRRNHSFPETPLFEVYNNKEKFILFNSGFCRNRNKDGLSLLTKNTRTSVLLTGDQHYKQFDMFVLRQYLSYRHEHHLIVPHHGGHSGNFSYNLNSSVRSGRAIISVGKNSYGHPFQNIVDKLKGLKFKVSETRIVGGDISITL